MSFETVNLKELILNVDDTKAHLEIIIQSAKANNVSAIKLIHGYGSHGRGGVISIELKKILPNMLKQRKITSYFMGHEWDISSSRCQKFLLNNPECSSDEDLYTSNPGITVIGIN